MTATVAPLALRSLAPSAAATSISASAAPASDRREPDSVEISSSTPDEVPDVSAPAQSAHLDGEHRTIPQDATTAVDPNTGAVTYTFEEDGVAYTMTERTEGDTTTWVTTYAVDGTQYTETLVRDPDGWSEQQVAQNGDTTTTTTTECEIVPGNVEDYLPEDTGFDPIDVQSGQRGPTRQLSTSVTVTEADGTTTEVASAVTYEQQIRSASEGSVPISPERGVSFDFAPAEGTLDESASGQFLSVTTSTVGDQATTTVGIENRAVWTAPDGTRGTLRLSEAETYLADGETTLTRTTEARGMDQFTLDRLGQVDWELAQLLAPELAGTDGDYRSVTTEGPDGQSVTVEEFGDLDGDGTLIRSVSTNGLPQAVSLHRGGASQTWIPGTDTSIVEQADGTLTLLSGGEQMQVTRDGWVVVDGEPAYQLQPQEGESLTDALTRELGALRTGVDATGLIKALPETWQKRLAGLGAALAVHALLQGETWHSLDAAATSLGSLLSETGALLENVQGKLAVASKALGILGAAFMGGAAGYALYNRQWETAAVDGAMAIGMAIGVFNPLAGLAIVTAVSAYMLLDMLFSGEDSEAPPVRI